MSIIFNNFKNLSSLKIENCRKFFYLMSDDILEYLKEAKNLLSANFLNFRIVSRGDIEFYEEIVKIVNMRENKLPLTIRFHSAGDDYTIQERVKIFTSNSYEYDSSFDDRYDYECSDNDYYDPFAARDSDSDYAYYD